MRNPTPVTTRSITADSGSSRYDQRTVRSLPSSDCPIGIHSNRSWAKRGTWPAACSSGVGASRCSSRTAPAETTNDRSTAAQAMRATARRDRKRAPRRPFTAKPARGRSGTSQRRCSITSPAHQAGVLDVGREAPPEQGDDDGQADSGLGRGHGHDEEDEHLPGHRLVLVREGDERQIDRVEHQLDAHQDDDGVAPDQDADAADGEQERGDEQEELDPHHLTLRLAMTTAPIMAAIRRSEAASNANRYFEKSRPPTPRAAPNEESNMPLSTYAWSRRPRMAWNSRAVNAAPSRSAPQRCGPPATCSPTSVFKLRSITTNKNRTMMAPA